jgi:hypothetical protein
MNNYSVRHLIRHSEVVGKGGVTMGRGKRVRLLVAFGITMFIMGNTIRHMFEGVKPFDWLMLTVEVAVLVLIAWEIGRDIWHRRKMRIRYDSLFQYLDKGQQLHWSFPQAGPDGCNRNERLAWENSAKQWIKDTAAFLRHISPKAATMFLREVNDSYFNDVVNNPDFWLTALFERLRNLREIMEKCDVYF